MNLPYLLAWHVDMPGFVFLLSLLAAYFVGAIVEAFRHP